MTTVVGRDRELAEISSFLGTADDGPRALLIEGEAGIGKTTLWRVGVEEARERGYRVLASAGAESETHLSFTALRDLVADVFDDVAEDLPPPQRRIIAVILLREEPTEQPPTPDTIAVAFVSTLRALAARAPTLLAIDDAHWLDPASASALEYAIRRFRRDQIRALVAQRVADEARTTALSLDRAFGERLLRLRVVGISLGALHRILRSRLDLTLPRPMLQRVQAACAGNPFFALQIGAVLKDRGQTLDPGAPLPIPGDLHELLRRRIDDIPPIVGDALLAVVASASSEIDIVEAASTPAAVEEALATGIVVLDGTRLRFTHPLLGETVYLRATTQGRRDMHLRLAGLEDPEVRGQHLALGTSEPSLDVAAAIDRAARAARRRGATASAAALAEHAARLTPPADVETAARRTLAAAMWWTDAGDARRSRALVEPLLATLPAGALRAQALSAKARAAADLDVYRALIEEALAEPQGAPNEQAQLLFQLCHALIHALEFDAARDRAQVMVELAEQTGDLEMIVFALSLAGRLHAGTAASDTLRHANELERETVGFDAYESSATWLGWWLVANDELDAARELLVCQHRRAVDDGDEWSRMWLHWPLTELECRAGNYDAARAYAEEGGELAEQSDNLYALWLSPYCRALVAAHTGDAATARADAEDSLTKTRTIHSELFSIRPRSVLGFLAVSEERYADAVHDLEGLAEPALRGPYWATYPLWGDLLEALVSVGEIERAKTLLADLDRNRHAVERPGAAPVLTRCRGLVQAASGSIDDGIASLEEALRLRQECPAPLERARTLLALGELQRRARRRRTARETLHEALSGFERIGASIWAERARGAIGRIGGRSPGGDELTPSEQRIAELVAGGKTNREVAAILVVADRTVESALTQIYRKLNVRSRTDLARKLRQA